MALNSCQPYYQTLLIVFLKFKAKNLEQKTANLNVSLKDLKITNAFLIAKSVEKR